MPELPEVERARKTLHERCVGKKITTVRALDDQIVFGKVHGGAFNKLIKGHKVINTGRRGKQFWLELSKGICLFMHFGMTGEIHIKGETLQHYRKIEADTDASGAWPPKYTKLELEFGPKLVVAFSDPRRLGRISTFSGKAEESPIVSKLGFDPILDPPDLDQFSEKVRVRRTPIKALLLNQAFSAGVGNWIADEVLYQSMVHPSQYANTLDDKQIEQILLNLKGICEKAVEVNADSKQFPAHWLFHYRWSKGKITTPSMPNGNEIVFETVGGRTSAIVPKRQCLLDTSNSSNKLLKRKEKSVNDKPRRTRQSKKVKTEAA